MLGLHPEFVTLETEEEFDRASVSPDELVMGLACRKARAANEYRRKTLGDPEEKDLILAADTVVSLDGEILEKPRDEEDAYRMLSMLSGRKHEVYTGIAAIHGRKLTIDVQKTDVYFRPLSEKDIRTYIASGEPMDKAGAYGAQKRGCLLIAGIDGDFFNVVGLPVSRVDDMLRTAYGIALTDCE